MNRLAIFALLGSVSALALIAGSARAAALPSGGHYVSGKGEIGKAGQSLTVKQSSTTGVIDWNKFSIGSKNAVTFDNGSGATLNRVTGGNLSTIAGSLHATGSLYLMNSSGVIVSGTGRVVTGGSFVATTGNISNTAFGDGDTRFKPGRGTVINRGSITAGGTATLSGRDVADSGTIRASRVNLQAQNKLVIGGEITARNADGSGGTIIATGRHIDVGHNASLSASGTRGGTVLIGGDVHGGAIASDNFVQQSVRDAATTVIARGAQISADGSHTTGGNIVIWSDGHTSFNGKISAEGQISGGFAEVSSHDLLGFTGTANLTSTAGKTGELLLDPENVTISTAANSKNTCSAGTCTPTGDNSVLNVTTLENALETSNVVVNTGSSGSQTGNITVEAPITWSANTLTLDAFHSINIDATMSATGTASLTLTTNDGGTGGDYRFGLGPTGFAGNITFANTSEALIINGKSYTLLGSMSDVQTINNNLYGNYALANSLDASSVTNWIPIGTDSSGNVLDSGHGFTGTFTGLGNTISNLTVDIEENGANSYAGLFGYSSGERDGAIRDIGMIAGAVNAGTSGTPNGVAGGLVGENAGIISDSYVTGTIDAEGMAGGLAGVNSGTIMNSYATGTVTSDGATGGLVGSNPLGSTITNSYATGAVTGVNDVNGPADAGGLVGTNGGVIRNSYATGMIDGGGEGDGSAIGGLVGDNIGDILNSYAMGTVEDGSLAGGFIGYMAGGSVASNYSTGAVLNSSSKGGFVGELDNGSLGGDYWDKNTTGQSKGIGTDNNNQSAKVKGLTTLQLEGTLPNGFSTSEWSTGPGLLPYLTWQFPSGTPQAISGQITHNGTPVIGDQVLTLVDGSLASPGLSMSSGASGFYYLLFASGTIGSGNQVLAYVPGANGGATLVENASATVNAADIFTGYLYEPTADSAYSTLASNLATAIGGNSSVESFVDGLGLEIAPSAASFKIDQAIDTTNLVLSSTGSVTQTAAITATNVDLLGTGGNYTLTDASNSIGTLTANTGSIDLASGGNLTIGAAGGNAAIASGALTITTGGNLALNAGAVGTTVDLVSAGTITEQGPGGGIEAGTLTGSAGGAVKLNVFNEVTDLGNFSTRGHAFSLQNEDYDLTTTGTINVGGAALRLTTSGGFPNNIAVDSKLEAGTVDLVSTAKITESTAGDIDATTLTGSADAAVSLTSSSNTFTDLGPFSTSGNHPFKFTDDHALTVDGAVDAGSGILDLTTVGSDNDLIIHSAITGGTVNLVTTGEATENSSGAIKATDLLNVTANTGIYLPSHKNRIKAVGTRTTNSGPNKITL